jgi:predicted secreted protein
MPVTAQVIGHGSQLSLDTTVPATGIPGDTWLPIEGVSSIDLGSNKIDTIDTTDLTTSGTTKKFIGGLEDPGDISLKFNLIPGDSSQASFQAAKDSTLHWFQIVYPGAVRTIRFQGIITGIDESIPDDKIPTWSAKIKVSGPKTYS